MARPGAVIAGAERPVGQRAGGLHAGQEDGFLVVFVVQPEAQRLIETPCQAGRVDICAHPQRSAPGAATVDAADVIGGDIAALLRPLEDKRQAIHLGQTEQVIGGENLGIVAPLRRD